MIVDTPPVKTQIDNHTTILGTDGISRIALGNAIEIGYRQIDTALVYGSHIKIGKAIRESGIDRASFFIATKIPGSMLEADSLEKSTKRAVKKCLEELQIEYVDTLYLHGPDAYQKEVLDTLAELQKERLITHIGLSNVSLDQIAAINKLYKIAAVQVEFNPYSWDDALLRYCKENKISVAGYRPFRNDPNSELFSDKTLAAIAAKVNVSVSELILGWMRQKGVSPIAKASDDTHLKSNFKSLENPLSDEDIAAIDVLNRHTPSCLWQQYSNKELLKRSEGWLKP